MTQWYRIKKYSTRDTQYSKRQGATSRMFPLGAIVRVLVHRGEKNGWFEAARLEGHPDLIDLGIYMRYYFAVRLQPIDDLEVFRILVERSKHHENTNTTATTTDPMVGVK